MNASAEIIEKIRKLLRLSRSSNPHEARLAMQRALEMAREHDVSIEGLNPDEQSKEKTITHRSTADYRRIDYDKEYAVRICSRFFRITPIFVTDLAIRNGWPVEVKRVTFVGTKSDLEIAFYVYGFLTHHFAFCWRKYRGRFRNRRAYVDGMFYGIYSTMEESEPERTGTELVISDHKSYISAVIGSTTASAYHRPDHEASAAAWAGYVQGRKTNICTALKSSDGESILALN